MIIDLDKLFASKSGRRILENAYSAIEDNGMLPLMSGGVVLGLSGGADSVMLLLALLKIRVLFSYTS